MASKNILVCDIHQDEDDTVKTRTVTVDGNAVELELCAKAFESEPLSAIMQAGRELARATARAKRPSAPRASSGTPKAAPASGPPLTSLPPAPPAANGHVLAAPGGGNIEYSPEVRAWAREQGMKVGVNGRIKADVVSAYVAAHS